MTDSVTTRLVLAQTLILLLVCGGFALLWGYERSLLAVPLARLWAPRFQQAVAADALSQSDAADAQRYLRLRASPPPLAVDMSFLPATRTLRDELLRQGVMADQVLVAVGAHELQLQLWLRLPDAIAMPSPASSAPAATRWVSPMDAPLTGLPALRVALGVGLVLLVVVPLNLRYVRRLTRPIAVLSQRWAGASRAPGSDGAVPQPVLDASAPSELRALDAAFARHAGQLLRIEQERALLLAGVSHDIRSPLARIRLAAELLPETPDNVDGVDAITRNVDLADRLIASFLEFIRSGDQPLDETVDLADTLRHVVAGFGRPEALLHLDAPQRLTLRHAHRLLLERLVANLIDNALKHGRPPVRLLLVLEGAPGAEQAVLTITDQGAGIPADAVEGLMAAFARGDASRGQPGFGLGLAIVQQIVTRMQGQLSFTRQPVGQRVELRLPVDRQDGGGAPR